MTRAFAALVSIALFGGGCAAQRVSAVGGDGYVVYVASESADQVSRIRFAGGEAVVEVRRDLGRYPAEIDGPHGVAVSADGRHYYVTLGHGRPYGSLLKLSTASDSVVGSVSLGLFPATVDVTPDGEYGFVSNFNLHGDHVPSSISKVHLPSMTEMARTETCTMPHGSRVNVQGTRHYSVCMMDQLLVEIDVETGQMTRTFSVAPGSEGTRSPGEAPHRGHASEAVCSPTWAQPSADGASVFVACNRSHEILEVDVASWSLRRRFATGEAPYNLDVSSDGRLLLATLKNRSAPGTEVFDLSAGESLARVPSSTVLPHGVAVAADSRYAFVSVEGSGREPGWMDVIDLGTLRRVASVELGQQAGGIAMAR